MKYLVYQTTKLYISDVKQTTNRCLASKQVRVSQYVKLK